MIMIYELIIQFKHRLLELDYKKFQLIKFYKLIHFQCQIV